MSKRVLVNRCYDLQCFKNPSEAWSIATWQNRVASAKAEFAMFLQTLRLAKCRSTSANELIICKAKAYGKEYYHHGYFYSLLII